MIEPNFTLDITDKGIEREIVMKCLDAPRITPGMIADTITGSDFHVFPGTTVTVCCLRLRNGFNVVGQSACASLSNFDEELGKRIAFDDARQKIWALEGYLLRSQLAEKEKQSEPQVDPA